MPSAKLRSANLPFFYVFDPYDAVADETPASRTPSGRSNQYATRARHQSTGQAPVQAPVDEMKDKDVPNMNTPCHLGPSGLKSSVLPLVVPPLKCHYIDNATISLTIPMCFTNV